jgi:hypothetical protein
VRVRVPHPAPIKDLYSNHLTLELLIQIRKKGLDYYEI